MSSDFLMYPLRHAPTGVASHFWCLLVAALPLLIDSALLRASSLQSASKDAIVIPGPSLENAAIMRGIDELALSQNAMHQAGESQKSAKTSQEELVAQEALAISTEPYEKVKAFVPDARAQVLIVRKFALLASQHRDHTRLVEEGFGRISAEAAEQARKTTLGWIAADASKTAAHTATIDNRGDRLASAVAAAAEPYHLALLRNQKFCEETYAKSKSAQSSSAKLITDAKKLALKAQELQASGMGIQGQQSFGMASNMMNEAENLRQWGNKLYTQANTACGGAAGYALAEQQAATNAAMTTIINAPMKLPK